MWPNFPDAFVAIMKFKFPGEDEDTMVCTAKLIAVKELVSKVELALLLT